MSEMDDTLGGLEQRVGEKWAAAAPLPPGTPQFPREQWASYPTARTVALLLADRMLDFDELTHEQWVTLCLVMQHGGKTRIA